jgi:uncharacterized protein (DUF305 family)
MTKHLAICSLIAAVTLCAAGAAGAADQVAKEPRGGQSTSSSAGVALPASSTSASTQMHAAMMDGMKEMHSMQPSGDADKDFAAMMEHHHAQAVKMTQAYLKGAKDQRLKAWAQKTLDSQQKELKELRALNVIGSSTRQAEAPKQ